MGAAKQAAWYERGLGGLGWPHSQVRPSAGGWGLSSQLAEAVHTVVGPEFPAVREDVPALKCFHAPDPVAWASHVVEGPTGGEGQQPPRPAADVKGLAPFPRPSIHTPPPPPPLRPPPPSVLLRETPVWTWTLQ